MRRIKLGVIGISGHLLTRIMLPLTTSNTVEIVALASRNLDKSKEAAANWQISKAYGSYEALLDDPEIEAVYIPLPNHLHLEWVKKSILVGKHVICEKPLTMNALETKEIMDLAKEKHVKVMEAFMYRFHPKWKMVRELIKVKGIGEINAIHTIFTYKNDDPKNIRNNKEYGGGALMDIGCYAISTARFIMNTEPNKVLGMLHYSDLYGTDVLSSGIMDFGEARALFTVSTSTHPTQKVSIYGTGGLIEILIPFNDHYDVKGQVKVVNSLGERMVTFEPTNQYDALFSAFAKAIREDAPVPISLNDSYMNMRIIDQLFESGKTGQWETI